MKKNTSKILITILFLAGLSLLLYPLIANEWNNYRQKRLISNYDDMIAEKEASGEIDYPAEWSRATSYNDALLPSILPDSFAIAQESEEDEDYMACLNLNGDGMMGIVEIPKIKIRLPIFHTTNDEVLQTAAGHLEGSSLPVGGENTHAVISAHRGLPSAALFTDLDKLKEGDHFLLKILDDTLCYEVDQIMVVEPEETSSLAVEEGMDLVTLLTCTPYGVNSHRLLVRGHRVPYVPEELEDESVPLADMSFHTNYLFWVIAGLGITAVFSFCLYRREKKLAGQRIKAAEAQHLSEAASSEAGLSEENQQEQISQEEKKEEPQGE